jgi:hypothetical protein
MVDLIDTGDPGWSGRSSNPTRSKPVGKLTLLAVLGAVGGVAAAIFAMLAWLDSRQRQPFAVRRVDDQFALTRSRRPTVEIRRVFVFGDSQLITADQAATTEWRRLERDQALVVSMVVSVPDGQGGLKDRSVSPNDTVTVVYRRMWFSDLRVDLRVRLSAAGARIRSASSEQEKSRLNRRRSYLDQDASSKIWKYWHSPLL